MTTIINPYSNYQKPVRGTPLNKSHPLARGLVGSWLLNEGTGDTVSDGVNPSHNGDFLSSNKPEWGHGYLSFDNGPLVDLPLSHPIKNSFNTLSVVAKIRQTAAASYPCIICGGSYTDAWYWGVASNGYRRFHSYVNDVKTGLDNDYGEHLWDLDEDVTLAWTYDQYWSNFYITKHETGDYRNISYEVRATPATDTRLARIGACYQGASTDYEFDGYIYHIYVWYDRVITGDEYKSIARQPYQMFDAPIIVIGTTTSTTMTADAGAFTITGTAASLEYHHAIDADAGAYTLTGQDAALNYGSVTAITAEAGAFAITGQDATLTYASTTTLTADAGAFALTGTAANLELHRKVNAGAGTCTVAGQDATLTYTTADSIAAGSGAFALTGQDAGLEYARIMPADAASIGITGQDAGLTMGQALPAGPGAYALTGADADLLRGLLVDIDSGAFTLTGFAAALDYSGALTPQGRVQATLTARQPDATLTAR